MRKIYSGWNNKRPSLDRCRAGVLVKRRPYPGDAGPEEDTVATNEKNLTTRGAGIDITAVDVVRHDGGDGNLLRGS